LLSFDLLVGWIDLLVGRLVGWRISLLVGWWVGWLVGCSVGWFVGLLIGWLEVGWFCLC
jgi:ribose/xylose/arabinose/galactoside ABC-type transport system permease subunit